ncbi:serine/threonine protein kinase [Archangium minus]|uniref:Serine/threonine protein kinase n=1 Tax=Archangium minus TaxID=83450 RepID=A0ABY9X9S2_9BACT|nr:serine/threonine protein kinase [Archangium minus]
MRHPGENTILAFVEGRLPIVEANALDAHIDTCESCRSLVVAAARASLATGSKDHEVVQEPASGLAPLEHGARFGRYTLLDVLGRGGMGIVYAAHDSALERKVALKVLRGELAARIGVDLASARLLREARIAARLSHPNVVTIYDVDKHDGQIFIAMEYVDGQPLSAWLNEGPHPTRAILEHFVQAGRGLAAAHAAGLVHRDFKPANVLVGKDGRVRVTDFGLAGGWTSEESSGAGATGGAHAFEGTRTEGLLGTPYYMAPEQHRGERAGPLADQFSFGVALHEALYRRRPFEEKTLEELALSKERGPVEPSMSGEVPERVRRAVLRALRPRKEERFASMDALLAELAPKESVLSRRVGLGMGLLALLGLGAIGARALGTPSQVCSGGEQKLVGVWDAERKRTMLEAFRATGASFAEDAAQLSAAILDGYTREWVEARRDACEATQVRKEQLEAHQALRMMCLDERLEEVKALGTFFTRADKGVVERAVEAARALPPLSRCADLRALSEKVPPPTEPAIRAKVEALGVKAAEVHTLVNAGRYKEALALLRELRAQASATGYQPLEAQLAVLQGEAEEQLGDGKAAEKSLREAVLAAEAGRDDVTVARAWTKLVFVVGSRLSRFDDALALEAHARAAIVRLGNAELERARLLASRSGVLRFKGDYQASLKDAQEALAIQRRLLPEDHPDLAQTLNDAASTCTSLSLYDEAREYHERALAIREKAFGSRHPKVAISLFNLGLVFQITEKSEEAEARYRRSLEIMEQASLGEHPLVARLLMAIGRLEIRRGEEERAFQVHERALALAEKLHGPEHPDVAMALLPLGPLLANRGRLDEALAVLHRARAITEKALGPDHPDYGQILLDLGLLQARGMQYAAAKESLERARTIYAQAFGPEHFSVGLCLDNLGQVLFQEGRHAEALATHRKALALYEPSFEPDSADKAVILLNIAEALIALRRYAEALTTAERALAAQEKDLGPESPMLASSLSAMGVAAFHLGQLEVARASLERAVTLRENGYSREALARARRYLARVRAKSR